MLDAAELSEIGQVISRNINVLQTFEFLNPIDMQKFVVRDAQTQISMSSVVVSFADAMEAISEDLFIDNFIAFAISSRLIPILQ